MSAAANPRPCLRRLGLLLAPGLLLLALAPACSEQPALTTFSLHGADEIELVCRDMATFQGLPLESCGSAGPGSLFAFVSSKAKGELALLRLTRRNGERIIEHIELQELDPRVPGITHLEVGQQPVRMALGPQGRFLFTLDNGDRNVTAVDVGRACRVGGIPWGAGAAGALAGADLAHDGSHRLFVSFPDRGVIAQADIDDCGFAEAACLGTGDDAPTWTGRGYAAELHTGNRSGWACDDGIDNDGDGAIDDEDTGCRSPGDPSETGCELTPLVELRSGEEGTHLAGLGIAKASPGFLAWRPASAGDGAAGTLLAGDALLDFVYELDVGEPPAAAGATGRLLAVRSLSPACGDNLDNDGDGLVDLADPQCSSDTDDSESAGLSGPACSDGADNDGDGLTDLEDPGCAAGGDPREDGPFPVPQCANGVDDDGDGLVDWQDPGCSGQHDRDETDPTSKPACANGLDDDGDGLVDLADPGCAAAGDTSERGPLGPDGKELPPACSDGLDNDQDGLTDGRDPDCTHAGHLDEWAPVTTCNDGLDNDGDGLVDLADPGCTGPGDIEEGDPPSATPPACSNGLDDDGDGLVDAADPGCAAAGDDDESQPAPACSNGLDDDGDGLVDLADPGCRAPSDTAESPDYIAQCNNGRDDDGDELIDLADPDCLAAGDDSEGSSGDGSTCANGKDDDGDGLADEQDAWCRLTSLRGDEAHKPACANGRDDDGDGRVDYPDDPGCQGRADDSEADLAPCAVAQHAPGGCFGPGDPRRALPVDRRPTACTDGLDNDGDGLVDALDPGCSSAWDGDEVPSPQLGSDEQVKLRRAAERELPPEQRDPALVEPTTECSNGLDDDGDGKTDLQDDGCAAAGDAVEGAPELTPQCSNGRDDDGDGLADYPDDPDCPGPGWDNERGPWTMPACANGRDDDGDGRTDLADEDCPLAGSDGERVLPGTCGDGLDGDGDGLIDRQDPDCQAGRREEQAAASAPGGLRPCIASSGTRTDPWCATAANGELRTAPMAAQELPACANGRDDDGDGLVDADDPGCSGPLDNTEVEAVEGAPCRNELDLSAMPECSYAGGNRAADSVPPQCADGIDNDQDGRVDLADEGCGGDPLRDSEWDHPAPAQCSNGVLDDLPPDLASRYDALHDEELRDLRSPGCTDPSDDIEAPRSRVPDCANTAPDGTPGDDDADGLANELDPGCFGPGDDDENDGTLVPSCSDGLDNDRDGLVDEQDQPACRFAGGRETGPRAAGLAGLELTPDGAFLYALHRWQQSVMVLDLSSGKLVDTRAAEPFHTRKGIQLGGLPVELTMACSREEGEQPATTRVPEVCQPDSPYVMAYVTRTDGQLSAIQVKAGGADVHRPADASPGSGVRVSATLYDAAGNVLGRGPASPAWFPALTFNSASQGGLQSLGISPSNELGLDNPFGLRMGPELLQNRVWQAVWEGELPGSLSATGRFDADLPGVLHDGSADFCQLGVVPGDRLLLLSYRQDAPRAGGTCGLLFGEKALAGREGFEYCIREVAPHALQLQAVPADGTPARPGDPCPEVDPRRRPVASGAATELLASKRPLDPLPLGRPPLEEGSGASDPSLASCFPEMVRYRIRASGHFLVYPQGSALEHNMASRYGRCELQRSPNPLLQSRAWLGLPFRNEAIGFTFHAALEPDRWVEHVPAGAAASTRSLRGMTWRFEVQSDLNPLRWNLGSTLGGIATDPVRGRIYIGDVGLDRVWELLPSGTLRLVSQ